MPSDDYANPLKVSLPYSFSSLVDFPTEILANRFQAWRLVLKDLINYLKEYANVEEEIVRQQLRLQQAVGSVGVSSSVSGSGANAVSSASIHHNGRNNDEAVAINKFFLPTGNGLVQDLPNILSKFHQQNVTNGSKTLKEINNIILPKLDELRRDLLIKIKEIKNLQNDFKTNLGKEVLETKTLLLQYQQAIELSNKLEHGLAGKEISGASLHHHLLSEGDQLKYDPYLIKLKLDRQLKKQLQEENYLYEAYANLQNSGRKLESIVVLEIQNYFLRFLNLVETEHLTVPSYLVPSINNGFLSKEATFEWDSFINRNLPSNKGVKSGAVSLGLFIDLSFPPRKVSDLHIANYDTALNIAVRKGALERRSKYLKSYSSAWYVLTCNYFHEFKSSDRKKDPIPVLSIPLDQCSVSEHLKDDGKSGGVYKFVLYLKGLNIRHRSHNWVFRTTTYTDMINWYNDIKNLTSLATPSARARFMAKRISQEGGAGVGGNEITTTTSKKLSRTSSIISQESNARTIDSAVAQLLKLKNSKFSNSNLLKVTSRATTAQTGQVTNRLSLTFSNRNNDSPRLSNMINSDGTIVTPIEAVPEKKDQSKFVDANGEGGPAAAAAAAIVTEDYVDAKDTAVPTIVANSAVPGAGIPSGAATPDALNSFQPVYNPQTSQLPPQGYQPTPAWHVAQPAQQYPGGLYIVPGQQPQYIDPVLKQVYTLSPQPQGVEAQAVQLPLQNASNLGSSKGPRPQYFPTTPQAPGQAYYAIPQNGVPVPVPAGYQIFPQSPQVHGQTPVVAPEPLPYPQQFELPSHIDRDDYGFTRTVSNNGNITVKLKNHDNDDVDTLPSGIDSDDD